MDEGRKFWWNGYALEVIFGKVPDEMNVVQDVENLRPKHACSPIFLLSLLYGAQKDAGGARSVGIRSSKAILSSAAGRSRIFWSAFWVLATFGSSIDASSMRKHVAGRKYESWKARPCMFVLCNVTGLFRGGWNQRTFYGSRHGTHAVQGFKLRHTILYIEILIYRWSRA